MPLAGDRRVRDYGFAGLDTSEHEPAPRLTREGIPWAALLTELAALRDMAPQPDPGERARLAGHLDPLGLAVFRRGEHLLTAERDWHEEVERALSPHQGVTDG